MSDNDELMSYDYMTGFLMGRALSSKPAAAQEPECGIRITPEERQSADAVLLREMDREIIRRYIDKHMPKDLP